MGWKELASVAGEELQARLARGCRRNAHPLLAEWLSQDDFEALIVRERAELWQRIDDRALAAEYARSFPVTGAAPDEYRNRFFESESGARILTGIRFRGLDRSWPFVDVVWQDEPFSDAAVMKRTLDAVCEAYHVFEPRHVRFTLSTHLPAQPADWPGVSCDRQQLVAPLRVVAQGTGVPHLARVAVVPAAVSALYERYSDEYARLHQRWPAIKSVADTESRETLSAAEALGLLFEIRVDDELAGVYALQASALGLPHYEVLEILLYDGQRGRGLAPAAHVAACRHMVPRSNGLLVGSIGAINQPSRRTAERAGRRVLKCSYMYDPLQKRG
jgi:hypothetical protein